MALYCVSQIGSAAAQAPGNHIGFVNSGQTATPNCAGGKAEIVGGDKRVLPIGDAAVSPPDPRFAFRCPPSLSEKTRNAEAAAQRRMRL